MRGAGNEFDPARGATGMYTPGSEQKVLLGDEKRSGCCKTEAFACFSDLGLYIF